MGAHLAGLGKKERNQLAALLKAQLAVITPKNTANILQIEQSRAAQLLALWAKKGWLSRVKHGVYIPVSLQAETSEVMADDPWVLAKHFSSPAT